MPSRKKTSFRVALKYWTYKRFIVWAETEEEALAIALGQKNGEIHLKKEKIGKSEVRKLERRETVSHNDKFIYRKKEVVLTKAKVVVDSKPMYLWRFYETATGKPIFRKFYSSTKRTHFWKSEIKKKFGIYMRKVT